VKRAILDTSVFVAQESGRPLAPLPRRRAVAVSIVTVAELELGVLAARSSSTRACRLRTLAVAEAAMPLPITRGVATRFAQLVMTMRERRQARLKVQDAWIAATALHWEAELWTQDDDFRDVPGLTVRQL
jgi:predicted nucleic acid-binding protein